MIKNDVKNISIKKAAFINAAANYSCVILQLGFSAVLARILLPEDYGVIGVMTVFTTFFSVLANMGIGTAVIQNKDRRTRRCMCERFHGKLHRSAGSGGRAGEDAVGGEADLKFSA